MSRSQLWSQIVRISDDPDSGSGELSNFPRRLSASQRDTSVRQGTMETRQDPLRQDLTGGHIGGVAKVPHEKDFRPGGRRLSWQLARREFRARQSVRNNGDRTDSSAREPLGILVGADPNCIDDRGGPRLEGGDRQSIASALHSKPVATPNGLAGKVRLHIVHVEDQSRAALLQHRKKRVKAEVLENDDVGLVLADHILQCRDHRNVDAEVDGCISWQQTVQPVGIAAEMACCQAWNCCGALSARNERDEMNFTELRRG